MRVRRIVPLVVVLALGCRREEAPPPGRFAPPPAGNVRVFFTPLETTPTRVRAKWSVLGDRSWTTATASSRALSLGGAYRLSDPKRRGGAPTWEFDLNATRRGAGPWRWKAIIHGSNGVTATVAGEASGKIRTLRDRDDTWRLPVDEPIAQIGDTTLRLQLPL